MKWGRIKEEVSPGQCLAGIEIRKKAGRPGSGEKGAWVSLGSPPSPRPAWAGAETVWAVLGVWGPVYRSITQEPPNATCLNQPQQGGWGVVCPLPSHLIFRWRNRDLERRRGLSAVTLPWLELRLQSRYQHSLLSPLVTWSKDDQTSTVLYW